MDSAHQSIRVLRECLIYTSAESLHTKEVGVTGNSVARKYCCYFLRLELNVATGNSVTSRNSVTHMKHACLDSNCDMLENSHMHLMYSDSSRMYTEQNQLVDLQTRPGDTCKQSQ